MCAGLARCAGVGLPAGLPRVPDANRAQCEATARRKTTSNRVWNGKDWLTT
jgi:hypothetical protein